MASVIFFLFSFNSALRHKCERFTFFYKKKLKKNWKRKKNQRNPCQRRKVEKIVFFSSPSSASHFKVCSHSVWKSTRQTKSEKKRLNFSSKKRNEIKIVRDLCECHKIYKVNFESYVFFSSLLSIRLNFCQLNHLDVRARSGRSRWRQWHVHNVIAGPATPNSSIFLRLILIWTFLLWFTGIFIACFQPVRRFPNREPWKKKWEGECEREEIEGKKQWNAKKNETK